MSHFDFSVLKDLVQRKAVKLEKKKGNFLAVQYFATGTEKFEPNMRRKVGKTAVFFSNSGCTVWPACSH